MVEFISDELISNSARSPGSAQSFEREMAEEGAEEPPRENVVAPVAEELRDDATRLDAASKLKELTSDPRCASRPPRPAKQSLFSDPIRDACRMPPNAHPS
jgi:hypothetical protein